MPLRLYQETLVELEVVPSQDNPKGELQELLQARHLSLPRYAVIATAGDAHEQSFRVECCVEELDVRTEGAGTSRRAAEQLAAKLAYDLVARG